MVPFVKTGYTFQHDHNDTVNDYNKENNVEPSARGGMGAVNDLMESCPPTSIWFFVFQVCLRFQFYNFNSVLPQVGFQDKCSVIVMFHRGYYGFQDRNIIDLMVEGCISKTLENSIFNEKNTLFSQFPTLVQKKYVSVLKTIFFFYFLD